MNSLFEGTNIQGLFVFAMNKRLRILIFKNIEDIGQAMKKKIDETIYEIPQTSPKKSNRSYLFL